ncbi:MAG: ATP phosphoribosyltransferase regulatory subunit [Clostridia bacterium]|nr:ATP phosphoribosyltransferase regulatory subunit [Clostridia bacterium]
MMNDITAPLRQDEKAVLLLRNLYEQYGYKKYKMSKFENYELYLENKSFLASEKIVTFTDPRGKLLALKPDITLSIVKNAPKEIEGTYKVYYDENVYRAGAAGDDNIKEIMQVGIELIGNVDLYSEGEVLTLAARSLKSISENSIIGISHMGLISALISEAGLEGESASKAGKALADKNVHSLRELCGERSEKLEKLAMLYGPLDKAIDELKRVCNTESCKAAIAELEELTKVLFAMGEADTFVLDFSVSNDMNYYNGITFQGFIDGIPRHVLSGGRYDALVRKTGLDADAIGFAVYPDILERFNTGERGFDVDVLLVYDKNADASEIAKAVEKIKSRGKKVCAMPDASNCRPTYKELVRFN